MNATEQAAVDIAALQAENERLREALEKLRDDLGSVPIVHEHGPEADVIIKAYLFAKRTLDGGGMSIDCDRLRELLKWAMIELRAACLVDVDFCDCPDCQMYREAMAAVEGGEE